jgi:hypothetical protein
MEGRADFLPFVPNTSVSTGFLSPFGVGVINDYRVEYDAELTRRAFFANAPSRLSGIFAFESLDVCGEVGRRYHWPVEQVQRFKPVHVLRAIRVNMEIVSLARYAYGRAMRDADATERIWRGYWSGEADLTFDLPSVDATMREIRSAGLLWEWIIDGVLLHESHVS